MFRRRYAYADAPATGRTGPALGSGLYTLARVVTLIAGLVAAIIVAGIVLTLLKANPSNDIVSAIEDAARWLVGPFKGLFTIHDHDWQIVVNWGLAAIVYLAIGRLIARLLMR